MEHRSLEEDLVTQSSTILVTGGAGFIGANFVLEAVRRGHRIVNLDKLTYAGNPNNLKSLEGNDQHLLVQGDIGDAELVTRLLAEHRVGAVVNFAAESHVDRSIDGPAAFIETNVNGTFNLLDRSLHYWRTLDEDARTRFRFLHVSTDEVYGSLGPEGLFTEETPYAPNSPYSASKAASDHLVRAYHHTYGMPCVTTNCSNNYGPLQFPEKLIPVIILKALRGESIPVYGDGSNVRDWLYVVDHCEAIMTVLEQGRVGETYNVGGNNEKTNLEVVKYICALLDELRPSGQAYAELITFVKDRPGHDRRYAIDAGKIKRELDWSPKETFETGMRKTVQWYLDNMAWCENILSGDYRLERLGLESE
ncbi:dTDP-glucose 4,6-dehydratase [Sulfidibacter corallicola]|uniref:dTDP-glucose 4,6-dehydratase n=1 Tax=Sulfidibacter corallicola TaxID=2818388 RepID=A0A8A4TEM4_SULCO|nr:dTDP-glucose 4,6-dehydratase [Sulfidibacter corallicola]